MNDIDMADFLFLFFLKYNNIKNKSKCQCFKFPTRLSSSSNQLVTNILYLFTFFATILFYLTPTPL